jgi:glutamate-5-semialdehyde dehydrogenase
MSTLQETIFEFGRRARAAARVLSKSSDQQRNAGVLAMADSILSASADILTANSVDLAAGREKGLSAAMLDRLTLTQKRVEAMAAGVREVAALPDPVGEVIRQWRRPNGLQITKVRVPIGVVGIIYESRPNVTSDAAVLCLKTGNATILRGGSESIHSNLAIAKALSGGLAAAGLPADAIQLIPVTDREAVSHLCAMDKYLDVIVPRGGKGLIETVVSQARMPVIKHYDGICVLYVDQAADLAMARDIVVNAKCQRPGVCNAVETVLVHRHVLQEFMGTVGTALVEQGVELRCDEESLTSANFLQATNGKVVSAVPGDFHTEFLDLVLAVKVVGGLEEALDHIENCSSRHSDGIITSDPVCAERFLQEVDSAAVYWNASTRFTDGGEFGFGAEIGISTDKLHARGPMALEELTTYKYQLRGDGQVRI